MDIASIIRELGFPIFVALFVLVRMEPAIKRLDQAITALTIVTAKSNGMRSSEIMEIVDAVSSKTRKRRFADRIKEQKEGD
jgi:hypothetical protein